MNNAVIKLLKENMKWDLKKVNSLEQIGGLSNTNFKVIYNNQNYFIRICKNDFLKKNPLNELHIIKKASNLSLCTYPVYFNVDNGNMVMPWIYSSMPSETQSNSRDIIKSLVTKLKDFHSLKDDTIFNPFNEIRNRIYLCDKHNINLPNYINILIDKLNVLENDLSKDKLLGLCHNDLNPSNILITKTDLFIVDYELSGMNDIFFDLATIAWLINNDSRKILLKEYFGYYHPKDYDKLIKYLYVVKMLNATWSLLKSLDNSTSYDYVEGANIVFRELLKFQLKVKS